MASAYSSYEFMRVTFPSPFVAHLEINRPAKLNAFSRAVWLEFGRVFRQLSDDSDVRVVVLSGAGDRAFTAGLDVSAASSEGPLSGEGGDLDPARKAKALRGHIEEFQTCISEMEKCEKPVICVLHAVSLGLAIDISCCADVRLAASNTRFAVKEVDIGLAADIGTLARLPKIVGSTSWVKDVCMSARDFDAREALQVGFVSQVHEDKERTVQAALEMAGRLAEKSPVAVQGTKELLNYGRENGTAAALRYTTIWNSVALQAGDVPSALMSVFSKKKPTFEKL
ncbi:enoyl-CoA hydratase/isomerase family protein [Pochonia chlamydosporia 170]|uniref:Enoyl-CoA hydratase/isomerase family protein n=1 Tax=Pochonia chlamydosporia 170 TaxID=1380566 RepID=A0A179F927_METCM|nr:enoyl-CoA hydratase/isomerase family protein [Pochonia chlamydosporia 170]OAQ61791.1 enoyl-CoA hydratase/isomerase family protein [Pochonia chlamydosporia 170]